MALSLGQLIVVGLPPYTSSDLRRIVEKGPSAASGYQCSTIYGVCEDEAIDLATLETAVNTRHTSYTPVTGQTWDIQVNTTINITA